MDKKINISSHGHSHSHHGHTHGHSAGESNHGWRRWIVPALSLLLLVAGMMMSHFSYAPFVDNGWVRLAWYIAAFIPVGMPVVRESLAGLRGRDFFNEFTLMTVACIGAFCIGEYPEAVGVMLFYSVGETLQDLAVGRATDDISRMLDIRSLRAVVVRGGRKIEVKPDEVKIGETIEVRPGQRVPLDGVLVNDNALFDTSALTGESMPREITSGAEVLAGMIPSSEVVSVRVTRHYEDSALSRILAMVRDARSRKAHTELFIRRFSRIYTPAVIGLAVLLVLVPWIVSLFNPAYDYDFAGWLYRSLVFLVISCPCALVVSVPLSYFAGIGAASRFGILFKGGNYLETVTRVNVVAFDKTGTMTTGKFSVSGVSAVDGDSLKLLSLLASVEGGSTHPLARALVEYVVSRNIAFASAEKISEIPGQGVAGTVDGVRVLAGNARMMESAGVSMPDELKGIADSVIVCSADGKYAGHVILADTLRADARATVDELRRSGVGRIVMLSGDKSAVVADVALRLGIDEYHGDMLPQDKAAYVEGIARNGSDKIAFVGDGMNDAPVLAVSNVGVAMGGLGSDAAIESADVVIQDDNPLRLATAMKIGRSTHAVVLENIIGAIGVKVLVMILGAAGIASLWGAVFADVGVALLAVLNSMRILWKKY